MLEQQIEVSTASSNLMAQVWGSAVWAGANSPADLPVYEDFFRAVQASVALNSPEGGLITAAEREGLLLLPRPNNATLADVDQLLGRLDAMSRGEFHAGTAGADAFITAFAELEALLAAREADGWTTLFDGAMRALAELSGLIEPVAGSSDYPALPPTGAVVATQAVTPPPPTQPVELAFPAKPHYFSLLDLRTGFVRRGRLGDNGRFPPLILPPSAPFLVSYFNPDSGHTGSAFFFSTRSGRTVRIPAARMGPDQGPDSDGDELSDFQELIRGTNARRRDSDGDGVPDGAEMAAGTNPLDGEPLGLGTLAARDTPGTAVEIDTINDFAVVADSNSGLAVFNVANPLAPVLLSQFISPGNTFEAVATAGDFVVAVPGTVTAATARVHLFALSADGTLTPTDSVAVGAVPETVVAAGRYAYASGRLAGVSTLAVIRLRDALLLRHVPTPGGSASTSPFTTLAIEGDVLWALKSTRLYSFRISGDNLLPLGELAVSGLSSSPLSQGLELAAAQGRVYIGGFQGFRVIDGSNPAAPTLLYAPPVAPTPIDDPVLNGSGLLLPATGLPSSPTRGLSVYDVRNDRSTNFLTSFVTPGETRGTALHRGYALVADGSAGLSVVNYLAPDGGTNAPAIALRAFPTHPPDGQEADEQFFVSTTTSDDVQVRDVEFYIDGVAGARSGKFPFAATLRAPPLTVVKTSFVLRAKATDTGGNNAWSSEITLRLLPDSTPPLLLAFSPARNSVQPRGAVSALGATFDSVMNLATLQSGWSLTQAGPDGNLGTADDAPVFGDELTFDTEQRTAQRQFPAPLLSGKYRARLASNVADLAGNHLGTNVTWDFTIPSPLPVAAVPANGSVALTSTLGRFEVRFDERLAAASVTPNSLRVVTTNLPNPIVQSGGVTSLSADGRGAVLEFPEPLANGGYRVLFTRDIRDVYGSPVETNFPVTLTVKGPTEWTNNLSGLWSVGTNWNTGIAPTTGDHVIIDRPAETPTVTLRGAANVTTLRSEEPFVLEENSLTVRELAVFNGSFGWNGQARLSGGAIEWRGGAIASGGLNKSLAGTTLRNAGVFEWRAGGILFNFPGAVFHNLPGGVFVINKAGPPPDTDGFVLNGPNATGFLYNEGTLRKAGGTEASFFDGMGFLNTGLIDVIQGTLELSTATTNAGAITVAGGTRLVFGPAIRGGSFLQLPSGRITGEGTISMEVNSTIDGDYNFDGTTSITATRVRFARTLRSGAFVMGASSAPNSDLVLDDGAVIGSLDLRRRTVGTGALRVLNPVVFSRLTVGGTIEVRPEAGFQITNSMVITDQARLENQTVGRVEDGATLRVERNALLENLAGATLHLIDNARLETAGTSTQSFAHNAGWIRKSSGTNEARITGSFANNGRVTVESGGLSVESTGIHRGIFETETGTSLTFRLTSGEVLNEFTAASAIRGTAPVIFTKRDAGSTRPLVGRILGGLNVPRLVVSNARLFLTGGRTLPALEVGGPAGSAVLELDGDLAVTGEMVLQGASIQPASTTTSLTFRNGGLGRVTFLTLPTGVTMLNQPGAQLDLNSSIRIDSEALLRNQPGGTFTLRASEIIT